MSLSRTVSASIMFHGTVHLIQDGNVYASMGPQILLSRDEGASWEHLIDIPVGFKDRITGCSCLARRLFRSGVHLIERINDSLIVFAWNGIYRFDLRDKNAVPAITPFAGSRPLSVCRVKDILYYGEYRGNAERSPVHIWESTDEGRHWQPVYRFTSVRHIHGVFHDPYDGYVWVATGDGDDECGLWVTEDGFKTVVKVVGGKQAVRAVTLLFTGSSVFFGSDSPVERNFLYALDKKSTAIRRLQSVEESVFWGCHAGDALLFSTAVEPGRINTGRNAVVWCSRDGDYWERLASFRKDIWPMKYFQYGQVRFPSGLCSGEYVWMVPFSTERDQFSIRVPLKGMTGKINEI